MHAMLAAVKAALAGKFLPPDHWAMQAIAPVLKPHLLGRAAGDFRDVTLTSNDEKLFSRMLEMRLRGIVEELGILDSAQHGFRKGLICDTAMWQVMSVTERQALVRKRKLFLVIWDHPAPTLPLSALEFSAPDRQPGSGRRTGSQEAGVCRKRVVMGGRRRSAVKASIT